MSTPPTRPEDRSPAAVSPARRLVFLGLGANLGDRAENLAAGLELLGRRGMEIEACSRLYVSAPADGATGAEFLNLAVGVRTALSLRGVLAAGKEVERSLGRTARERYAPRPLDVDILLDGESVVEEVALVVPHPRLHLRRFVLVPLAEIAPEVRHPILKESIATLLARCPDRAAVRPWAAPDRLAPGGRPDL